MKYSGETLSRRSEWLNRWRCRPASLSPRGHLEVWGPDMSTNLAVQSYSRGAQGARLNGCL